MRTDESGEMIVAMVTLRDSMAKQVQTLRGSDAHDDQEKAEVIQHEIHGLHEAMKIAIRYFDKHSGGMTWYHWSEDRKKSLTSA